MAAESAGQDERSLARLRKSVEAARNVGADQPKADTKRELAISLDQLATCLFELGGPTDVEAVTIFEEAVNLNRTLCDDDYPEINRKLVQDITDLSAFLASIGRLEDAFVAADDAVMRARHLTANADSTFERVPLAKALFVYSDRLSDGGRHESALLALQEAADIFREACASGSGHEQELFCALHVHFGLPPDAP